MNELIAYNFPAVSSKLITIPIRVDTKIFLKFIDPGFNK